MKKTGLFMLRTLQRLVMDNYKLAYLPLKEVNDQAKNKKTMVIRELIETTMNRSY
jgi:predicted secreted acid phosphatase